MIIWKHPILSLKGPNVLHSLPRDFDWCQPQPHGKGRNSLGNVHQAMMQGGKKKSYKAAICWFLDSHFPTSCEEGVCWSFVPCFLVERNAPQKRPVLFAKSGHAIWIWRSLYETSHPAGRVALIPVIIPRATYLPRNPWLVLPWLVRHGIKIIKWVCAILRESSQKNDKKKTQKLLCKNCKMLVFEKKLLNAIFI